MADESEKNIYDLAIIGSGPGGYVGAIRASQLGLKTIVIEMDKAGGVCGNWGCIPSKALLHQASLFEGIAHLEKMGVSVDKSGLNYAKVQALSRKAATKSGKGVEYLLKKNKVELLFGRARIASPKELRVETGSGGSGAAGEAAGEVSLRARNILVATGSRPKEIPGFVCDNEQVLNSTGILSLKELPKSLLILGAGAIGMEFAYLMNAFGVQVSVIEMLPRILPLEDPEVSAIAQGTFAKQGITFYTGVKAGDLQRAAGALSLSLEAKDGSKTSISGEKLLVAVGRTPNTEGLGLENLGIKTGCIPVSDYYQTSVQGVYAIGDVIDTPLLAHLASKEAEIAVEHIAGHGGREKRVPNDEVPSAVYTEPGISSFGLNDNTAAEWSKASGRSVKKFTFPYNGIGKANAIEKANGLVKIIAAEDTQEILGCHIFGYSGTELVHEVLLAKRAELLPEDIATMIHAHPTISEGVMEAARGIEDWAIHI